MDKKVNKGRLTLEIIGTSKLDVYNRIRYLVFKKGWDIIKPTEPFIGRERKSFSYYDRQYHYNSTEEQLLFRCVIRSPKEE